METNKFKEKVLSAIKENKDINDISEILVLVDENKIKVSWILSENLQKINEIFPNAVYAYMLEAWLPSYVPEETNEEIYKSDKFYELSTRNYEEEFDELLYKLNNKDIIQLLDHISKEKSLNTFIQINLHIFMKKIWIKKFLEILLKNNNVDWIEEDLTRVFEKIVKPMW